MNNKNIFTFKTDEKIERNRLVTVTNDYTVGQASAGDNAIGIVFDNGTDGAVDIATSGIVRILASSDIEAGEEVSAAADGKVKVKADGDSVIGIAVTGGTADSHIDVLLK